ncbi:MAG: DUF4398 domain-containing protein [Deltaproteobacteria bacterium]|nr:DUF4398 domain-containing protein [Deltaproteobacteria bacterium]
MSTGCGPARFLTQVDGRAATAVTAAKKVNAATYAPYEFTAATEYLRKAREEAAYAEYQVSIAYGRQAEELAIQARAISERKAARATGDVPGDTPADVSADVPGRGLSPGETGEPPSTTRDSP